METLAALAKAVDEYDAAAAAELRAARRSTKASTRSPRSTP